MEQIKLHNIGTIRVRVRVRVSTARFTPVFRGAGLFLSAGSVLRFTNSTKSDSPLSLQ